MTQIPTPKDSKRPRIAIIGGGFAGLNAAKAFKNTPVDVVLIDKTNYHLFQPLLYQVATAGLASEDIASATRVALRRQKNVHVILSNVEHIDTKNKKIHLDAGVAEYDYLILATGMETNYFGNNTWEPLAPGLKTLEDALECRRRILTAFEHAERTTDPDEIRALLTFVVIGAGPTGVEMAGAIREIALQVMVKDFRNIDPKHARVILVDAGPRVLAGYDDVLSQKAQRTLEKMGVEVRLFAKVNEISDGSVQIKNEQIHPQGSQPNLPRTETIQTCTVIWAAGVHASPIARSLNVPLDNLGRLTVLPDLSLPDHPEIFIAGDLAKFTLPDKSTLPGLAPVAIQQGRHAAQNILRRIDNAPPKPFHYKDRGQMATIGKYRAVAQSGPFRFTGYFAWLAWLFVHLISLIGFRNRIAVLFNWAYAYIGQRRGARLIIDVQSPQPPKSKPQPEPIFYPSETHLH